MFSRDGGMDMKSNQTTESMALKVTLVILDFRLDGLDTLVRS